MATDAAEVVKLLKGAAKQASIGFAFGTNGKDGELVAEKGKSGDQLISVLKKLPGIKQSCSGEVSYDGTTLTFVCDQPVSGFAKSVEGWGRAAKFSFKVDLKSKKDVQKEAAESENEEENEEGNALFAADQVKHRLAQSKTKDMFFAFGLGNGKAPSLLGLHPLKTGDKLVRIVRKENGAIKRAWGRVVVEGSMATFHCEEEPFSGMKKSVRGLFKGWKLPLRVTIVGPQGEFNEDGDEDEVEEAEGQEAIGTAPGQTTDDIEALRRELASILPQLQAVAKAVATQSGPIRENYQACEKALSGGDAEKARGHLAALKQIAGTGVPPELERMRHSLENALPKLKDAMAKVPSRTTAIKEKYAACDAALKAGDVAGAREALFELAALARVEDAGAEVGQGVVAFAKLSLEWQDAKREVQGILDELREAIEDEEDEETSPFMTKAIGNLDKVLARFNEGLADTIDALSNATVASDRADLGQKAEVIAQTYLDYLAKDPIIAHLEKNPYGSVAIASTLAGPLNKLRAGLATRAAA